MAIDGGAPLDPVPEVAGQLRQLADRLASGSLSVEQVVQMSALLDAALAVHPDPDASSVGASWRDGTGVHPLAEAASGVFPPLELEVDAAARRASLETRFGPAWEGPPGLVHGGFVAAAFDMAMSALAAATCGPTVTRWLRVRYLKPTAIDAHLRFEVECDEPVGRLLSLRATLDVEGRATTKASAEFATVASHRYGAARDVDQVAGPTTRHPL